MKCNRHEWDTDDKEWCWRCEELTLEENKKKYNDKMETLDIKHFKNQLNKGTILPEKLFYMLQEELDNGETKMTLIGHDVEDDLPNHQFIKFGSNSLMFPIVKK
jgi:hypothetical protein